MGMLNHREERLFLGAGSLHYKFILETSTLELSSLLTEQLSRGDIAE